MTSTREESQSRLRLAAQRLGRGAEARATAYCTPRQQGMRLPFQTCDLEPDACHLGMVSFVPYVQSPSWSSTKFGRFWSAQEGSGPPRKVLVCPFTLSLIQQILFKMAGVGRVPLKSSRAAEDSPSRSFWERPVVVSPG